MYAFFEPELPDDCLGIPRTRPTDAIKVPGERRQALKVASRGSSKISQGKTQRPAQAPEKKTPNHNCTNVRQPSSDKTSYNVLDLNKENYFSCAVGRPRTNARFLLQSSDEVVSFLKKLADASSSHEAHNGPT